MMRARKTKLIKMTQTRIQFENLIVATLSLDADGYHCTPVGHAQVNASSQDPI